MKLKKLFYVSAIILIVLITAAVSCFAAYSKFDVHNPFSVAIGLFKIFYTEDEYTELRSNPRVIIAKPDASLDNYMMKRGFSHDEEAQLGSLHVYTNGDQVEYVHYSVNRFFSKWSWQE